MIPSYDSNCYALSTDGRLLWKFPFGNASGSSVAVVDEKYNEIWHFRKFNDRDPGTISIKNGLAIFGSWDNHVYALNIEDGMKKWSYIAGGLIGSSPIVIDKRVYVGSFDNHLHCFGIEDGIPLWKLRTGGQIDSSPVFYNGVIYFGSYDQYLYALSPTGERSWNFLTGGMIEATPEIKNNVLYIGSFDTYFYAIDLITRRVLWKFQTGIPTQSQMKEQVELVTEVTSHRFTRWRPEIIRAKTSYEFRTESKPHSALSDQPYQASHPYESGVSGSYGEQKKKKKQPEFGFF